MKKIYFLLAFLLISSTAYSQLGLGVGFKIGPFIGTSMPSGDYSGESYEFHSGDAYGFESTVNYGLIAKLSLGPLNGRAGLSYGSYTNEGLGEFDKPNSNVMLEHNMLTISLGTEFGFGIPLIPIKPYAGFDILFTSISGEGRFNGTNAPSDAFELESASRTGLGLGIGTEVRLGPINFDLGLRYNMHNLFGKEFDAGDTKIDEYRNLNDDSGTINNNAISSRSINTINIFLGVLIGF